MGSRANIVVMQDGTYDLFYCHWCASSLPSDLFWGPAHAVAFARNQLDARSLGREIPMRRADQSHPDHASAQQPEAAGWLDDNWAEGGAVIDLDRQVLILYGGEDLLWYIPLRRLYLQLLHEMWAGWDIRWAHRGIVDMADYVGLPQDWVTARKSHEDSAPDFADFVRKRFVDTIGSILLEDDELRLFPLGGFVGFHLAAGPALVGRMKAHSGYSHLPLAEWGVRFPRGGFHVDLRERHVHYWKASTASDPETYIFPLWPGWRVTWLQDNYEAHLARLGDRVSLPKESTEDLLSQVQRIVMHMASSAPTAAALQTMFRVMRKSGAKPNLDPLVWSDRPLEVPAEARHEIFEQAVRAWKKKMQQ
jgi:hypothetical protein